MTTHWNDLKNTDVILHCGSNSVENHPVSARWLNKAHENGAKWIVVDPRYTRTAELADIYCRIRSGTDIAFYGGMINYILQHNMWQRDYVLNYTNATYLLEPEFEFDIENGLWSGYNETTGKYDTASWHYQTEEVIEASTTSGTFAWASEPGVPEFTPPAFTKPKTDPTLKDEMCVLNQMKKHYSRYDLETVSAITGADVETLELVYKEYGKTGKKNKKTGEYDKNGVILYALGQTQHSYGAQNIRCMGIIQLLLGNVGVPGGGVAALRGKPNVQGATDMCMMPTDMAGYLQWPNTTDKKSIRAWCESQTYSAGYYTNKPKFLVSFLKEFFGENAQLENDYGYDWLPKVPSGVDFTISSTFEQMAAGIIKGYFCWGMNPAHSTGNTKNCRDQLAQLDWLVDSEWHPTTTTEFWLAPDMNPKEINTTVYFLPAALIYEKPGTILNSGRWLQYRYQAVEPYDQSKTDFEMCDLLWKELVKLYEEEGGTNPDPILNTKWDYYVDGKIDPRPVSWAMNGYRPGSSDLENAKPDLCKNFTELKADGSTACAIWIYSGHYNNSEAPLDPSAQPIGSRIKDDPSGLGLYPKWAYAWPMNRRILYNRAASDINGKPWTASKKLNEWHEDTKAWDRVDVPDWAAGTVGAENGENPPDNKAFFMTWEQNGRLESYGMADGPLPEHFEPFESPTENILNGSQCNPMMRTDFWGNKNYERVTRDGDDFSSLSSNRGDAEEFPYVATTYSITEHWQTGSQTGSCPALTEAIPTQWLEISEELAKELGLTYGDKARVWNSRGDIIVDTLITKRMKPLTINGKTVHQVGLTHHFGFKGEYSFSYSDGSLGYEGNSGLTNDLTPNVGDPNTGIPEYKAFLVNIEKA
ncbi:MAG: molybdopterin-dependent oxidoreductase [Coriobacteriales bacterium]|nr:molybdopterin-dependent oxidoreductase [Coriobacteriales bacterium]